MIYKILILNKANDDLNWFRKSDKQSYIKCFDIVRDIMINPRNGIAKPERLKYFEEEVWSRRVNDVDRIIYTIYESELEIEISSFKGHYD
jgi:toxin YoeB